MSKYVIGNLKMHLETVRLRDEYLESAQRAITSLTKQQRGVLAICPPHIYLEKFITTLDDVIIGAQDTHEELRGAHTGSTSAKTVAGIGAKFTIIGHSERRAAGEALETVVQKIITALLSELQVIVCVGYNPEGAEETETVQQEVTYICKQIMDVVPANRQKNIMIAYEPVWAIGSGKIPSANHIQTMKLIIQKQIMTVGLADAGEIPVLYGGSVKTDNVRAIISESGVDGVLVGGASLEPMNLVQMVKLINS